LGELTIPDEPEREQGQDFSNLDMFKGTRAGFQRFVKPHLNKIVQAETKKLKFGQKCAHPECNSPGAEFGHWPLDVDTILERMLEPYRLENSYEYLVPLKEFCDLYRALHRGKAALKVGRPVCRKHNMEDQKIIKKRLPPPEPQQAA
jgi:hypothetical protein